ncbi:MAG: hypothetical protein H0V84_09995 [Actinobacteria bacterium]|nr:hypothetical protein [Actinomycetota bacterium]
MTLELVRYADRPGLHERRDPFRRNFPEYMSHNEMGKRYWRRLDDDFADFQLVLLDAGEPIAEARSIPVAWDGTLDDLPSGWDTAYERAAEGTGEPNALTALWIGIVPGRRGERLGSRMIEAMRGAGRAAGLQALIAAVRPTAKAHYPLIPIERYARWRRPDGSHFDPWIRLHERVGGEILRPAPESMTIVAPVTDWQEWTGLTLPEDGDYVVPEMLAPLVVRDGVGRHVEPNVWMRHTI